MHHNRPHQAVSTLSILSGVLGLASAASAQSSPPGQPPAVSDPAKPSDNQAQRHSDIRLIAEHAGAKPGSTILLGLHMTIAPGWHTYWNGRNDSGTPLTAAFDLPPGYTLGPWQWPSPKRYLAEGDILDHIYENTVTILIPLTIPATATPGQTITIRGKAEWLVCKEACVFEDGAFEQSIAIIRPEVSSPAPASNLNQTLIKRSLERMPAKALPAGAAASWNNGEPTLRIPGATRVEFYPAADCIDLVNPAATTAASRDTLRLKAGTPSEDRRNLRGILAFRSDTNPASPLKTAWIDLAPGAVIQVDSPAEDAKTPTHQPSPSSGS
jgi:thiol:disulfide interchange protein DsbD